MSDVFAKRRPMIDLDEYERHRYRSCSTEQKDDDPLAELLRIIGGKDESHETDFDPKTPLSARARQDAGEPGELNQPDAQAPLISGDFAAIDAGLLGVKQPHAAILRDAERSTVEYKGPNAQAPLISGDFAAIEAGLLGAPRERAMAAVSEANMSNATSSGDIGSQRFLPQDNQPASRHARVADGQNRSRRPLYVMVAIVIVGIAGIAASFGLKSRASGPLEIASVRADNGPDKQQTEATSGANVPAQDAAILSKPPEPSPMALVNGTERTVDLPQAKEKTLSAEPHAQLDNGPAAVPAAPAQTPTPAEPLSTAAPVESDTVKTDLVRPDGTQLPNGTPPQANINGAPLGAPQSPAAAKAPTVKAAGHVAKPLKPATARHPGSHGQPRQIANKAKATPMSPLTVEPAPSADPKAETSKTQTSPSTNGALGFVQSAVNSLTSTAAKLLSGERIESGSRP
ncbi:MAG: hypothetical protein WCC90_19930 [Methylocella sp.]